MTEKMSRADQIRAERKERGVDVLAGVKRRLGINENERDPNYFYRYFNDDGDRIFRAKELGYEVVADRSGRVKPDGAGMGSEVSAYAGVQKNGAAMKAVLMRIPKEIHDEDQALKKRAIDETETSIQQGKVQDAGEHQAKFYGGLNITRA